MECLTTIEIENLYKIDFFNLMGMILTCQAEKLLLA